MTGAVDSQPGSPENLEAFNDALAAVRKGWKPLAGALVLGGLTGIAVSFAFTPRFLSSTLIIPPQQQQGSAASALASLSALSGLVGGSSLKSSADQYMSMLESRTVSDNIIKRFSLDKVYDTDFHEETLKMLARRVQVSGGKKDGLIRIDVQDSDPRRAAEMARQYVAELGQMTSRLAVTEAQLRRVFFERLLNETKQKLTSTQVALEASGFSSGALRAEPKAAADSYAKLRAELTGAQVKLQTMQVALAATAPEVRIQQSTVDALSAQVSRLEASDTAAKSSPDYIGRYRDFKYQETLFDLYSKQYELARMDEGREGAVVQVVDEALPAERKMFPRRSMFGAAGALGAFLACVGWLVLRSSARRPRVD